MSSQPHSPEDPFLHRQLRELPSPIAPTSLTPRVLARIRERAESVWWERPIFEWPLFARASGVSLLVALAVAIGYLSGWTPVANASSGFSSDAALGPWQLALVGVQSFKSAATLSLTAVPRVVWWTMGGILLSLYASCLGLGTLVYRQMALRR